MTEARTDLALGTFSAQGPWSLEFGDLTWRDQIDTIRSVTRREVPRLIARPRWPGVRTASVVARLGWAVGSWWATARKTPQSRMTISRNLRTAAEALGPTYIKLGQIISSGQGIFPEELVAEFKLCRDQVPAEPFATVQAVVEADLGHALHEVFADFDTVPIAAASIAQVHRAVLRREFVPGGGPPVEVVVKVQRPDVATLVRADLRVLSWLAPILVGRIPVAALANPPALVEVFAETIAEELDFRLEAESMLDVARVLRLVGQDSFVIPRPHPTLVTPRVLVMERLTGFAFDDVSAIKAAQIDTHAVIRAGMIGFMEGALLHGVFHGDLHGGNLFIQPDGRTALLDFGITGRLSERRRSAFIRFLFSATMNDPPAQLAALRDMGALPADTDLATVISDLGLDRPTLDPTQLSGEQLVAEMQRVTKALVGYGAKIPKELMLFVKNMVFLDGAIATLAPDLDLLAEIQHIALHFAQTHGMRLAADAGVDPNSWRFDIDAVRGGFGVDPTVETLTYRDLQARRALIRERVSRQRSGSRSR